MIVHAFCRPALLGLAAFGAGVWFASAAFAGTDDGRIDVGATTCKEFVESVGPAHKFFAFWFDGYLSAKQGTTVFDANKVQQRLDAVAKLCQSDLGQKVLPLMEKQK
jgi:hypothetical protein